MVYSLKGDPYVYWGYNLNSKSSGSWTEKALQAFKVQALLIKSFMKCFYNYTDEKTEDKGGERTCPIAPGSSDGPVHKSLIFWSLCQWLLNLWFLLNDRSSKNELKKEFGIPKQALWRRQWHPTLVLLPGKSHGRRSLVGCSPWGREESDMTERLHFHFSFLSIGEGNGNPLQCSCLENPRDGVTQSRTQLKWLSSSSSKQALTFSIALITVCNDIWFLNVPLFN